MLSFKNKLAKNYINAIGWSTKNKYVLIESDDWGAVRMPSTEVFNILKNENIEVDKFSFDRNDSVESEDDFNAMYTSLLKFKDCKGNNPVITAYSVVANPNFEKIEASGKKEYHNETVLETYKRSDKTKNVPNLIKIGMEKNIYVPQFHGREHIHVRRYMEAINSQSKKELLAFENHAIISSKLKDSTDRYPKDYFKGFGYSDSSEHAELEAIHRDGLKIFEEIFGFPSISFVAQGTVFGDHLLEMLSEQGVKLVGGQQQMPNSSNGYKTVDKYWGTKNKFNQLYWRRNCLFEPARNQDLNWVDKCLEEMQIAFRWGKPAVISTHRENFIGSIREENRVESLRKLETLFEETLKRWPDVQFISTAKLAEIMLEEK